MSADSTKHASTGEALAPQPVDLEVAAEALKGINARLSEGLSDAVDADVVSGLTTAIAAINFAVRRMVQIRHRDPEEALAADPTYGMADRHALADTRDVMAEERSALADARDQNQGPAASDRRAASRNGAASAGDRAAEAGDAPVDAGMPRGDRAHNPDNPAPIPDPLVVAQSASVTARPSRTLKSYSAPSRS